jgi:hypothetical protein
MVVVIRQSVCKSIVKIFFNLSVSAKFLNWEGEVKKFHNRNFFNAGNCVVNVQARSDNAKKARRLRNQKAEYSLFRLKKIINFQSRKPKKGFSIG